TETLAGYARSAGFGVRPRATLGVLLAVIVLPALVVSLAPQVSHKVRLCDDKCADASELQNASVPTPETRPNVEQAALAWYAQAERAYHALHPQTEPVPMLIVATAGGGIRAAYWTATVLETLDKDLGVPPSGNSHPGHTDNLMRNLLFAISGVSGG